MVDLQNQYSGDIDMPGGPLGSKRLSVNQIENLVKHQYIHCECGKVIVPIRTCFACDFLSLGGVEYLRQIRDKLLEVFEASEVVFLYAWEEKMEKVQPNEWCECGTVPSIDNLRWHYVGRHH